MTRPLTAVQIGLAGFSAVCAAATLAVSSLYAHGANRLLANPLTEYPALRITAAPFWLEAADTIPKHDVELHLVRAGYYESPSPDAGTFLTVDDGVLRVTPRSSDSAPMTITWANASVSFIEDNRGQRVSSVNLEPETILATEFVGHAPLLQIDAPSSAITGTALADALVASEDGAFYVHHGIDLRRLPLVWWLGGGASTLTQQVARVNILMDRQRTLSRKLTEIGAAMALERRHTKAEILQAYVNGAFLGTSRGFQVRGFSAAADEFYGVRNLRELSAPDAATLVALLNQPMFYLGALRNGDDAPLRRQRNRVLRLMHRDFPDRYPEDTLAGIEDRPVTLRVAKPRPTLSDDARYFLDYSRRFIPPVPRGSIETTLDSRLQRIATEEVIKWLHERGMASAGGDGLQAALVSVQPATGAVVAMVGGRSYEASQFNRATGAARQVGSLAKPFVYLAAVQRGIEEHRADMNPEAMVSDRPTRFVFDGQPWSPGNYRDEYSGIVSWRRALELSRNVAAVNVAEMAGFDRVAAAWNAASGQKIQPRPSIALGAFEATPLEVARAYTVFTTGGPAASAVLDMLRGVVDHGTGAGVRAAGFSLDAAGKTGTTNDARDAWFVGFTPGLLTVVWIGRDDNRPMGLSGGQAAVPLWTAFMKRALAGRLPKRF